ncbi:hypothetical protein Salmuc_03924 [Salipiger mucosus DSM 16094]|uniref:Uncharacterized protein n=1 Tax=Salipiger mucosus DSM 16094 TaxID=1123237 RepID=S9QFC3_9RHOB|nr:hypothetical protein Salmuc_03924 [Salipiger mucosus DSM 16094]
MLSVDLDAASVVLAGVIWGPVAGALALSSRMTPASLRPT